MNDFARYIPHTEEDCEKMLEAIGLARIEELFRPIPEEDRLSEPLRLPDPLSEADLLRHMEGFQSPVFSAEPWSLFLGGGAYRHFIPSVVSALSSRSEFYTAYTPYQPEISQGTLQAIFEYQSLMCQLTGMEVSNASMYDGASSLAEAVLMAHRINKRKKVLVSDALHPDYRRVIRTYLDPDELEIVSVPYCTKKGETDFRSLERLVDEDLCALVIQSPNFFGVIEDYRGIGERIHQAGGILIVGFSEAIAYGMLSPPGHLGADIVAGEGQSLGLPVSFGGPYLGIFTTRERYVRNMPGRLVGETVDRDGKRGFVLTLATREQHIRRERATSNICTNEGLCALMATIFLACLGRTGLREMAQMNRNKAEYLKQRVSAVEGCRIAFSSPTFNEFVLKVKGNPETVLERLRERRILGGLSLARFYPELDHHILVTVTEMNTREEIDRFVQGLGELMG